MARRELRTARTGVAVATPEPDADPLFGAAGECLRRAALGLVAALFVTRAFFESEGAERGEGLVWVFAMLAVAAVAVASTLLSGSLRFRWSWADAALVGLVLMVGLSTSVAADRRAAINLAWEWGAVGIAYVLVRNLPRGRSESATLAGVLMATAVAVAAYGLYQVAFEFGPLRDLFLRNPAAILRPFGIEPGTPAADAFKQRLLYSNEPYSTFALANSLAGFLVGPLTVAAAVAVANLRGGRSGRVGAFALAAVPALILLLCLILTKSRSAQLGWLVALAGLAWRNRRVVPRPMLAGAGVSLALLLAGLVGIGYARGLLDREILTESTKSLRYRVEYWKGTWDLLRNAPPPFASVGVGPLLPGGDDPVATPRTSPFWAGVGPGNFGRAYLGHKPIAASEEIKDPHNLVLEVWATSGLFAAVLLVAALGLAFRDILGRPTTDPPVEDRGRTGWLLVVGALGWVGVVVLGHLNPFVEGNLGRWLVLGGGWAGAVALGSALWRRTPIPAEGLGLGAVAIVVNLLAAGGIAIPTVALMLWITVALGLNLRDDRRCGTLRTAAGLAPGVGLACAWAALAGTFFGAIVPFWKARAELEAGQALMSVQPPAFEPARAALTRAIEADHYATQPWVTLAELEYRNWRSPESFARKEPRWERVLFALSGALDPKWRDPDNIDVRRRQASYAREILAALPAEATPLQMLQLRATVVKAYRRAASIYPTSAMLRYELARASSEMGMYPDAIREARNALLLDDQMPHPDKKLPPAIRAGLAAAILQWEKQAEAMPKEPPPPARPAAGLGSAKP